MDKHFSRVLEIAKRLQKSVVWMRSTGAALKNAALPEVHVVVATVPAAVAVQSVAAADQVPVGVAPAPAVAPFMSQYRDCPNSVLVPPIATTSSEATKRAALMARGNFMFGILIWPTSPQPISKGYVVLTYD